jgi:hypothetical protein
VVVSECLLTFKRGPGGGRDAPPKKLQDLVRKRPLFLSCFLSITPQKCAETQWHKQEKKAGVSALTHDMLGSRRKDQQLRIQIEVDVR